MHISYLLEFVLECVDLFEPHGIQRVSPHPLHDALQLVPLTTHADFDFRIKQKKQVRWIG
jgi:hypothetical protein